MCAFSCPHPRGRLAYEPLPPSHQAAAPAPSPPHRVFAAATVIKLIAYPRYYAFTGPLTAHRPTRRDRSARAAAAECVLVPAIPSAVSTGEGAWTRSSIFWIGTVDGDSTPTRRGIFQPAQVAGLASTAPPRRSQEISGPVVRGLFPSHREAAKSRLTLSKSGRIRVIAPRAGSGA